MTTKPFVFVLMPFDTSFDDIYKLGIKATCEKLNAYCERVDEQIFEENILERIYNQIRKADIVIADLTGKNPNVFYETGYAHALGKKVILLTQHSDDIPFDLKHYSHIIYQKKILMLQGELEKRINWFLKHPTQIELPNEFNIDLYFEGHKLEAGENQFDLIKEPYFFESESFTYKTRLLIKIGIYNNSNATYESTFKIGIVIGNKFISNSEQLRIIKLNQDTYMHLSNDYFNIYPSSWEVFEIELLSKESENFWKTGLSYTIRLFTEMGVKDFHISNQFIMEKYPVPPELTDTIGFK